MPNVSFKGDFFFSVLKTSKDYRVFEVVGLTGSLVTHRFRKPPKTPPPQTTIEKGGSQKIADDDSDDRSRYVAGSQATYSADLALYSKVRDSKK
jgi:hypothetical protein